MRLRRKAKESGTHCRIPLLYLCIQEFCGYDFSSSIPYAIQPPDPFHLICSFQRFCDTFCFCHLFYQSREHFVCLTVNIGEITIQFAAGKQ